MLLLNPHKKDSFKVTRIHMGLTLLGSILKDHGHEVLVVDYSYLDSVSGSVEVPALDRVLQDFRPEIVGVSVFTYMYDETVRMISDIAKVCDCPIFADNPQYLPAFNFKTHIGESPHIFLCALTSALCLLSSVFCRDFAHLHMRITTTEFMPQMLNTFTQASCADLSQLISLTQILNCNNRIRTHNQSNRINKRPLRLAEHKHPCNK